MGKSIKRAVHFLLFCSVLGLGNGLQCYQCSDSQSGDLTSQSSKTAQIPDKTTCSWGRTPHEDFLKDCPDLGGVQAAACVSMYIDGKYKDQDRFIKGTIRECVYNRFGGTANASKEIISKPNIFNELKKGILANVHRDFVNPAGKQFLYIMSQEYDDAVSNVKVVACDIDGCIEPEEEQTTAETTPEASSTTQDSGAVSNVATSLLGVTATILLLISNSFC